MFWWLERKTAFKRKYFFLLLLYFKIHLRTECVFNICQLIIWNVLIMLFLSNIVLKWFKLLGESAPYSRVRSMQSSPLHAVESAPCSRVRSMQSSPPHTVESATCSRVRPMQSSPLHALRQKFSDRQAYI